MKKRYPRYFLLLASGFVSGCSVNPSAQVGAQVVNRDLELQFSPVRIVTRATEGKGSLTTVEWAGMPGQSITTGAPQVRTDVLRSFRESCGFEESQLAEVRVVKHRPPAFYEVWIFNDPQSQREDGKSGLSVVLKQLPNNGGVDFSFYGTCHSKKAPVLYSAK